MVINRRAASWVSLVLGFALAGPSVAPAQSLDPAALEGDWVRVESNYDPNNQMRISIARGQATLTRVPTGAHAAFRTGQALWMGIQGDGAVRVRGSDGSYYPGTLELQGSDALTLSVDKSAMGNDQHWKRAGPSLDGDWERVAPPGTPEDGTQVRVDGTLGSIRFLPVSAPRRYRVGGKLWRNIGAGGAMEMLGSDGQYYAVKVTLLGKDSLRIYSPSPSVSSAQLWVRPGAAAATRIALASPPANPDAGGSLQPPGDLPEIATTPAIPAAPPPGACLATSLPHSQAGLDWGWGLTSPTNDDRREETLGIREHMLGGTPSGDGAMPMDIERSRIPGFAAGFAYVWQRSPGTRWEEHRDLTAAEFDRQSQQARNAGLRAADLEAYQAPAGMRYAGIWTSNPEGISWRVDYDQTDEEYGQAFQNLRNNGFRLVDMEAYATPNGVRYAAIWYQSCDQTNWRQLRNMTRSAYDAAIDSMGSIGFQVIDFESWRTANGQRYAAIWEQVPSSRAWEIRSDRDLNSFLNSHRQYVDQGYRLIDYEEYETPDGTRYAGVWAENDRRYDFALRPLLDAAIQAYRTQHGIPGMSVVVMQGEEIIYRRGFGWADSAAEKAAHAGTVYLTASVAKAIGATIAARLEGRGVLDLTQSTASFLDDMPSGNDHTVEQLLAKIGCARHYDESTPPDAERTYTWQKPALTQFWGQGTLPNCTPVQHYHYSTHGYTYVGAVLEKVTGNPIAQIIEDELTRPFRLSSMRTVTSGTFGGFGALGVRPYHLARGYSWDSAAAVSRPANYENTTWKVLGGGLQTDALDLARFGQLTRENAIADTTRLWTPLTNATTVPWDTTIVRVAPTVGLAWVLGQDARRRFAQHGGVTPFGSGGGRAHLRIYRDDGLVIAIMSNQSETSVGSKRSDAHPIPALSGTIARLVFANPPPGP